MGNGSPLAPPESFWTRLSRKVASLGPPMMGDPRADDIGKEKKKKKKSLNVVVFSDGTEIEIPEAYRKPEKAEEVTQWATGWAEKNGVRPITLDVDGMEDPFDAPINPYANIGIGGPPEGGFMNKAGNVAANMMTGGTGRERIPGINPLLDFSGMTEEPKFKPSEIRLATDLVGTEGGATGGAAAGARAGSPLGPWGTVGGSALGAGIGGVLGNQGADISQRLMGVQPREENPLHVAAREASYELFGRGVMGGIGRLWRGARAFGKYDPLAVKERAAKFTEQKIKPMLFQVVEPGGVADSVRLWVAKNPFTGRAYRNALEKQYNALAENVYKNTDVFVENAMRAPTPTIAGKAFKQGAEDFNDTFFKKASDMYDEVWRNLPEGSAIPWEATREFLGESASTNPLLASVGSPKIRQIAKAFNDELVDTSTKNLPDGRLAILEQVKDIDLETARKLRTAVGEKIRDWTPDADLPIKELQRFYAALTEDIMSGVEKKGGPGALDALKKANAYWAENMDNQETIMKSIYNALDGDSAKVFDRAYGFISGNNLESLQELQKRMAGTPGAWDKFRNMALRKNIAPSSAGLKDKVLWSEKYTNFRDKIADPEIEDMMFGAVGTPERKGWDSLLDIAKNQDEILRISKSGDVRSRFTSAEMYGPLTMGAGGGALLGYQQNQDQGASGAATGAATGVVVALGLSAISARSMWKLVSNQDFVETLMKIEKKKDIPLTSAAARIVGTYGSLDYEGKQALMEYVAAMKELVNPSTYEEQQTGPVAPAGPMMHGR